MFYLIKEHGFTPNTAIRYTICSSYEQYMKILGESTADYAHGYEFSSAKKALDYFRESVTVPKKS